MEQTQSNCALASVEASELESQVERQIVLGTWGRIHNLSVKRFENTLRIRARTPSHYIKQLVLHAVYEVIGYDTPLDIQFDIQVGKMVRHVLPGDNDLWGVPSS